MSISTRGVIRSTTGRAVVTLRYDSEYNEHACWLKVDGKVRVNATYYTDDKSDAIGTAAIMIRPWNGNGKGVTG